MTSAVTRLADMALGGKRVLVREDFNVPLNGGEVTDGTRIDAALPTIRHCLKAGAAVLLTSHLGRPEAGERDGKFSLAPVARVLGEKLGLDVPLVRDWQHGVDVAAGEVALLENIRFEHGETTNDEALGARLAALCDVFVMDAFGTAHRAHASTCSVIHQAREACAGPLLMAELDALTRALREPARPLVAIVGGAKVSTKLTVLERLAEKADHLIVGGGIANTFLMASGVNIGASLAEPGLTEMAKRISAKTEWTMPVDVMTALAGDLGRQPPARLRRCGEFEGAVDGADEIRDDEAIFDLGPESVRRLQPVIEGAGTIIWNGPLGVFEQDQFGEGTRVLADAIAASPAFSIAGGGDTLAAIAKYEVGDGISYLSTGGGAFLEFVEGKTLPSLAALQARHRS